MHMKWIFQLSLLVFLSTSAFSQNAALYDVQGIQDTTVTISDTTTKRSFNFLRKKENPPIKEETEKKHNKLTAVAFSLFLGHFGGHRLYLGTDEKIPILYTVTLGGGLILPFIDTIFIIFTKDLEKFENNENFFIWTPKASE